jgi:hypothetical protein
MTWFDLAIVLNALSLVAALFATGGLMVLATMLIQDPRGSDRSIGIIMMAIAPLLLAIPSLGLWLSWQQTAALFFTSLGMGIISLIFYITAIVCLLNAIEAAARP